MHIVWGVQSRCQKLCIAGLVGAQRTAQNNGNMKYVRCEAPLSYLSSIAKKRRPDILV